MNKLNLIFLTIIVFLSLALGIMTYNFFLKNSTVEQSLDEIYNLKEEKNRLQDDLSTCKEEIDRLQTELRTYSAEKN